MYGILLIFGGSLFSELAISLGKEKVKERKESIFSMGFLNHIFIVLFFAGIVAFWPERFIFSSASLPTFIIRVCLELVQAHITILAIVHATRSAFGFLRVITLPLLLIVDLFLGYTVSLPQFIGMGVITVVLLFLFLNHGIKRAGAKFVLISAINAVVTISLYKYNITHFNSVEAEQLLMYLFVLGYFFIGSWVVTKEHPVRLLKKRIYMFQSFSNGLSAVLGSFAFLFAPASIILAAHRSFVVMWSIIAGRVYFHEKKIYQKFVAFLFLTFAIILLSISFL